MITDTNIPAWYSRDLRRHQPDVVNAVSGVTRAKDEFYFTGAIRELMRARKVPRSIDIAFDMDELAVVARLEFEPGGDGLNRDNRWRALYTYMEIEAFAIMWNERPAEIHGIPTERISLHLKANDIRYPTAAGSDPIPAFLLYEDGKFMITPDIDTYDKEQKAA